LARECQGASWEKSCSEHTIELLNAALESIVEDVRDYNVLNLRECGCLNL